MKRVLVTLAVVATFFSLLGAGPASAAREQWGESSYVLQAPTPVTLSDTGWSEPGIGLWNGETKTGTLTTDLARPIVIASDSITLDGNGHTLTGSSTGRGVDLRNRRGVTVKNLTVTQFSYGFFLYFSSGVTLESNTASANGHGVYMGAETSDCTVTGNTATGNDYGIYLCSNNSFHTISDNTASGNNYGGFQVENTMWSDLADNTADSNGQDGFQLYNSSYSNSLTGNIANGNGRYGILLNNSGLSNTLDGNTMAQNRYNFGLWGSGSGDYSNTISPTNTVDGKAIYYWTGHDSETIDAADAGTVYLVNCNNVTVKDLSLSGNDTGVYLWNTTNSTIQNVQATNNSTGIRLRNSTGNTIGVDQLGNTASSNSLYGIWLDGASGNTLIDNTISLNGSRGVFLKGANNNTLTRNAITDNAGFGVFFDGASDNVTYGNEFLHNNGSNRQAYVTGGSGNVFDQPAPVGGNYWSDWTEPDADGDGFVDQPYVFTGGQDNLPIADPAVIVDTIPPVTTVTLDGTPGNDGWYRSDVQVTLSATDNEGGSGVANVSYSLDGVNWHTEPGSSVSFALTNEGTTTFYYRATDNAGNVEQAGTETTLLYDGFDSFDTGRWVDAGYLPSYLGQPSISPQTVDGRTTIYMETVEYPADKRRGIGTASALPATPDMAVEVAFKPLGDMDDVAELWLYNPATSKYLRVSAHVSFNASNPQVTVEVTGQGTRSSPTMAFSLGEWLLFRIDSQPGNTTISLLDANRNARWGTSYGVALTDLFGDFNVALSQHLGAPSGLAYHMKAHFDYVEVLQIDRTNNAQTVKIDKTPPTVEFGEATPAPNAAGWNNTDVSVAFVVGDNLSGVATTVPASSPLVLTEEGAAVTGSVTVTDVAGNSASFDSDAFNIDKTPPVITPLATTPSGPYTPGTWTNEDVTVHWDVTDSLSGVDLSTVPADNPFTEEGAGFGAGPFTVSDLAGNSTDASVSDINIDKTPPTLAFGEATPAPNAAGWNNTDVSIAFTADDSLSGVASTDPASPLVLTDEGLAVSGTVVVTDQAGNSASFDSDAFNIDKTPPVITAVATTGSGAEYVAGSWTNEDVTVHWDVTDELSGIDASSVPADSAFAEEGQDLAAGPVSVSDAAGNTASATFGPINIDKTPPELTATRSPEPNASGWNSTAVTVTFEASDALSGLASTPAPTTVSVEGEGMAVVGTAADLAGNTVTLTVDGINIDWTPPVLAFGAATPAPNAAGWNNSDVSIPFSVGDNLSGVATTEPASPLVLTEEGLEISGTVAVSDLAGNSATFTSPTVNIDRTPPVLSATRTPEPNAYGWNNTAVTVTFAASDAFSGLASMPAPVTVAVEGEGLSVVGTATDVAGNTVTLTVDDINIDWTPPTIVITSPAEGSKLPYGSPLEFGAEDALSGVDSVLGSLMQGSKVYEVTSGYVPDRGHYDLVVDAVDYAGNQASASRSFTVSSGKTTDVLGSGSYEETVTSLASATATATKKDSGSAGEAAFSFTCRYRQGDAAPSSRWPFQFALGDLRFTSTSYEWLLVEGSTARFGGSGTISGWSGHYGFLVAALDAKASDWVRGKSNGKVSDKIRVKIWDETSGAVVYDSQPGADEFAPPTTSLTRGRIAIKS